MSGSVRLRSLATSREVALAVLAVLLLGLTGSAGQQSSDTATASALPRLPPSPAPPGAVAVPSGPTTSTKPAAAPGARGGSATRPATPSIRIVDARPRPPAPPDRRVLPVELSSDDLDLSLPVRPVGVTKDGEMELPDTIAEVGWYRFGANPSSPRGTTVVAAHVDTRAEGLGPFARLRDAREGDEVSIVDRGGRRHTYRVAGVTSLAKKKIDWDQVFDRRGHPRLVLITCGGAYDQDSGYRDNVLVTAFPMS